MHYIIQIMFDPRITQWWIEQDILALSEANITDNWVNDFISSLVFKYIQAYFGADNICDGLSVLETHIELWWPDLIHESYALQCLWSITQTSAVLKEIIFHDGFQHNGVFRSCDLWAWTWILSLGSYISWLRSWLQEWIIHLIDHESKSLEKGKEILQTIIWSSFEVNIILGDIRNPEDLARIWKDKIQYWISETISYQTPPFYIDSEQGGLMIPEEDIMSYGIASVLDPFPEVIANIITHNPNFEKDVKSREVALFPDYVNNLYIPNNEHSTLELATFSHGPQSLRNTWQEFWHLKAFDVNRRWV